jgi:hypothetical protein
VCGCVVGVTAMGFTIAEKVFIIQHYFSSYGKGQERRPSVKMVM